MLSVRVRSVTVRSYGFMEKEPKYALAIDYYDIDNNRALIFEDFDRTLGEIEQSMSDVSGLLPEEVQKDMGLVLKHIRDLESEVDRTAVI